LQGDLGWGEFQAPPEVRRPFSPTVSAEQLGWDTEAYDRETVELKRLRDD
jgi:hypothetical protein